MPGPTGFTHAPGYGSRRPEPLLTDDPAANYEVRTPWDDPFVSAGEIAEWLERERLQTAL